MFHMYDTKICISVTSHALDPLPLSQTVTPSRTTSPLERDVLYGRPLTPSGKQLCFRAGLTQIEYLTTCISAAC